MAMMEDFNQFIPNEEIHLGSPTLLGLAQSVSAGGTGDTTDSGMQTALFNRLSNISPVTSRDITTLGTEGFLYPRDLMTGIQQRAQPMAQPSSFAPLSPILEGGMSGEMIQERMEWDSPYQARAAYDMNFPSNTWFDERAAAAQEAAIADMGRTTTMGTGWGRQPLIDPPPTYDYAGTGGLEGLPLSPFIPTANTLLPPVNQEMIGNWGGGAANRQEWAGPLIDPFITPWAGGFAGNPMIGDPVYNTMNPDWYGVMEARKIDRLKDVQNFVTNYGLPYLAAVGTAGASLPFYNPWDYNPFDSRIPRFR